MFIEAAAQSSSAFSNTQENTIAFVSMVKEIQQKSNIENQEFVIEIKLEARINNFVKCSFKAYSSIENRLTVSGSFTLVIQDTTT